MKKILSMGSINIDYTYLVDEIVSEGETIKVNSYFRALGGKGLNQSVAIAKADAIVYHCGIINKEDSDIIDYLESNGVMTDFISFAEESSGHAIIQVDKEGNNAIFVESGCNFKFEKSYIVEVLNEFDKGDYIILQNEINNLKFIIDEANRREMVIVLNPSPITSDLYDIDLSKIDYLIVNEHELSSLMEEGLTLQDKLELLIKLYPQLTVILTEGSRGSSLVNDKFQIIQASLEINPVNTSGAGDTFCGYFIASISKGGSLKEAMRIASIAAGIVCTRQGTSNVIPSIEEVINYKI